MSTKEEKMKRVKEAVAAGVLRRSRKRRTGLKNYKLMSTTTYRGEQGRVDEQKVFPKF